MLGQLGAGTVGIRVEQSDHIGQPRRNKLADVFRVFWRGLLAGCLK
jgi:hypothetical protein